MRALGAEIEYRNGYYFATAPGRLRGAEVRFPFVSVMGTENAMLAATLAEGHTVIRPAAQEPEVDDLIAFLQKMGAEVERTLPDTIEVEGRKRLRGAEHRVIPDRIEAGTLRRRRRGDRRPDHADRRAVRPPGRVRRDRSSGPASAIACGVDTIEVDGTALGDGGLPRASTSRPAPTRASRPTSSHRRRCC